MTPTTRRWPSLEGRFEQDGIAHLLVQFVDIHGSAKVKLVPARVPPRCRGIGAGLRGGARSGGWGRVRTRTT